ncbi:hypothetical protein BGX38DRAFT_1159834, partial [Terfezia claveryi]
MSHTVQNIFHRGALVNGQTPQAVAYTPQEPQHLLISTAKELVIILLSSEEGRNSLLSIANACEVACHRKLPGIDLKNTVRTFTNAMSSQVKFPVIIADDAYATNILGGLSGGSDILGSHFHFNEFEILINRPRVEQMVEAQKTGNTGLSVYQFQLACTILRCVGQIFCRYLIHCMHNEHPFNGPTEVSLFDDVMRVAGENLESGVFGSPINWYKDPSCDDPQPGQPFLIDTDDVGRSMSSWTMVDMKYIQKLVGHEYKYPAIASGPTITLGDRKPLL